jgi:hypothetical protein
MTGNRGWYQRLWARHRYPWGSLHRHVVDGKASRGRQRLCLCAIVHVKSALGQSGQHTLWCSPHWDSEVAPSVRVVASAAQATQSLAPLSQ